MSRPATEDVLDCVVVGAGAAGLAAAAALHEAGRTFVVLDRWSTHTLVIFTG